MFFCYIVSSNDNLFDGRVYLVNLSTKSGVVGIMENHAEAFFMLSVGNIIIQKDSSEKNKKEINVPNGGIAYFNNNILHVLLKN